MVGNVVDLDDFNNSFRDAVTSLEKKIPEVGGVISVITGLLWPKHKVSIWDAIKHQLDQEIDAKIMDYDKQNILDVITSLERDVKKITPQRAEIQNGEIITSVLVSISSLKTHISHPKNKQLFLPYMVVVSHLELGLLREVLTHGVVYYRPRHERKAIKLWLSDLIETYQEYKTYFEKSYHEAIDPNVNNMWLSNVVKKNNGNGEVTAYNPFLREVYKTDVFDSEAFPGQNLRRLSVCLNEFIKSMKQARLANILASTARLNYYLPDQEEIDILEHKHRGIQPDESNDSASSKGGRNPITNHPDNMPDIPQNKYPEVIPELDNIKLGCFGIWDSITEHVKYHYVEYRDIPVESEKGRKGKVVKVNVYTMTAAAYLQYASSIHEVKGSEYQVAVGIEFHYEKSDIPQLVGVISDESTCYTVSGEDYFSGVNVVRFNPDIGIPQVAVMPTMSNKASAEPDLFKPWMTHWHCAGDMYELSGVATPDFESDMLPFPWLTPKKSDHFLFYLYVKFKFTRAESLNMIDAALDI